MNLKHLTTKLNTMRSWTDGWNGYDARAPKEKAIDQTITWLDHIAHTFPYLLDPLFVTGDGQGGVLLAWEEGAHTLEIIIDDTVTYSTDIQPEADTTPYQEWLDGLSDQEAQFFADMMLKTFEAESPLIQSLRKERAPL